MTALDIATLILTFAFAFALPVYIIPELFIQLGLVKRTKSKEM